MKAMPASVKYVINPQNAVGKPNSLPQRLDKTTSQLLPTEHPFSEPPVHSVHERYVVRAIPTTLRTRSGQFGPLLNGGWMTRTFLDSPFNSLFVFAFLPT